MGTVVIPLGAFGGINRANITRVYVRMAPLTKGTVLNDNVEWWKD